MLKSLDVQREFILDPSLALYLPLYKLDGAKIMSQDAYGQLFTVTGALWQPDGRLFDGSDDMLRYAVSNWRKGDTEGAIFVCFKTTEESTNATFFCSADEASATRYIQFRINSSGVIAFLQRDNDTADAIEFGTNTYNDGEWHLAIISSNGSRYLCQVDLTIETPTVSTGADNGDWFADTSARDNVAVGLFKRNTESQPMDGLIREVRVYSREPSFAEKNHIVQEMSGAR